MGLRFRKSIKLGGGARINLSKSGVGFSLGTNSNTPEHPMSAPVGVDYVLAVRK